MEWTKAKKKLPPRYVREFPLTDYYVVKCKGRKSAPAKAQIAIASYDYELKVWSDHWSTLIKDVEYWIEYPK